MRAFKSVGGQPIVFDRVKGAYAWDVDENKWVLGQRRGASAGRDGMIKARETTGIRQPAPLPHFRPHANTPNLLAAVSRAQVHRLRGHLGPRHLRPRQRRGGPKGRCRFWAAPTPPCAQALRRLVMVAPPPAPHVFFSFLFCRRPALGASECTGKSITCARCDARALRALLCVPGSRRPQAPDGEGHLVRRPLGPGECACPEGGSILLLTPSLPSSSQQS